MSPDDLSILESMKAGRIRPFEKLFRQYYASLCSYALSITGRREVAEELIQDLFYVLWKEREKLYINISWSSYLHGAIRNRALQYIERCETARRYALSRNRTGEADEWITPQHALEAEELRRLVEETLMRMPPRRREIFRQSRDEGKTYAEMAAAFSVSVKTVEAEMSKALASLRNEMDDYRREKLG